MLTWSLEDGGAEALAEGLTVEDFTLATAVLGGGVAAWSLPAVEGIGSFADSALSEIIFALFERGTSSSSLELVKAEMSFSKLKEAK
jgi:hypothetical protein